ncbi:MAG: hypothetical protein OEM98_18625, partial [Gammaproteobacteria bacterium]|nr:hypothetical protein [Gammaproteobacteria bacterium]
PPRAQTSINSCPAFTTVSGTTPGSLVRLIQRKHTPHLQDPRLRRRRRGFGRCQPDASKRWKIG